MTYDGPAIFRAPIGNSAAQENFRNTVLDGVDRTRIAGYAEDVPDTDPVRVWGTKESVEGTWSNITPGDFLIFYRDGTYEYAAEVIGTEQNEPLGRNIWPNFEDGSPWLCIIYLREPVELGVDSSLIHDLAGYDIDYPMGFAPLNDMGVGGIRGRFGSVESFVYGDSEPTTVDVTSEPEVTVPVEALDGLHFPENHGTGKEALVEKINDAFNAGKHIIFTGPPGTGKTEIARRVSDHIVSSHDDVFTGFEMTTATADWSTFETVGGYMPGEEGGDDLEFQAGQVLRCLKERNQQRNDLLIIDEINRSDIDKSFGQLFTLLSGQGIELPFTRDNEEITIQPANETDGSLEPHEYVVPSSWRIFATMNSYDKASLYEMSYAFMRRFAFIYIDAPAVPDDRIEQGRLVEEYANVWDIDAEERLLQDVGEIWHVLNAGVDERRIGPALVRDILAHASNSKQDRKDVLTEAVMSYVFPQLEGVRRREQIVDGLATLDQLHEDRLRSVGGDLLQIRFDE
ncbi:MoxR family ATPase [Halorhabdus sp. CUG00001]|uniref:AAA family ATPase n=1 Tax=Halorhabdus sp. CUG00001 TaxID=2600297 RepID=UPI00131E9E9B|nr:MoxR family ATPase [Halorhabdus sp. CUG00001]